MTVCSKTSISMRTLILAAALATSMYCVGAMAQTPAPAAAAAHYTTAQTHIGILLDDPDAVASIDKYIPGLSSEQRISMAREKTLKSLQQYQPERFTDSALASIDAEFAKMPAKK
jgi:hypothetical protein